MMRRNILILVILIFSLNSCSIKEEKKLKISVSTWIGYSPILYAKEKKWLDNINIKILNVSSLSENLYLYKANNSDAFVGTQYEYKLAKEKFNSIIPLILFDRSNGGDVIMGNRDIIEYHKSDSIDAYLEMDSINSILLADFLKNQNLENKKINYINKDQLTISLLESSNIKNPSLLITYIPYNKFLENNGFKQISSTANNLNLVVVDALFVTKEKFNEEKEKFIEFKKYIDLALKNLKENPKEYYETIKKYYPYDNYENFLESLKSIVWLNKDLNENLLQKLQNQDFPIRDILK